MLYKHDFPDWFVQHVESYYDFDWDRTLRDLRNRRFFYQGALATSLGISPESISMKKWPTN